MKLSVQLNRDRDGNLNIAINDNLEELIRFSIVGMYDAVAIFQSMIIFVRRIEELTEEDKS